MDILTHIFLPLIVVYSLKRERFSKVYFPLAIFTILPDFDVFLGVHRSYLHSLLFLVPLAVFMLVVERAFRSKIEYAYVATFFLLSHIFLDFFAGGVPFLYPIVKIGVGVEFPIKISFGSDIVISDLMPRLVFITPESVYGKTFDVVSGFGVATAIMFMLIYIVDLKVRNRVTY